MKWTRLTGVDGYVEGEIMGKKKFTINHYYKTVLLPITVSNGDYCWDGKRVCSHFNNEGGHGRCTLHIDFLKRDKTGFYPKPDKCLKLKELC